MGKKAKTSRKGKKAWRANISSEDIEDFFEKTTKDALSGGNLSAAPSEDLFHVEKSHDLTVKRKIEKHREKVLRCDSVLKKTPFVQTVSSSKPKLKKSKKTIVIEDKTPKQVQKNVGDDCVMVDLWGDDSKGEHESNPRKIFKKPSIIPAVEIEPPGCSYNPTTESHQDMLAQHSSGSGDNAESTASVGLIPAVKNKIFTERIYGVGSLQSMIDASTALKEIIESQSQKIASQKEKIALYDSIFRYLATKDPVLASMIQREAGSSHTGPGSGYGDGTGDGSGTG